MGCSASFDLINHFDEPKYLKAEKAIIFSDSIRSIDVSVIMEKDIDIIKDQWPRLSDDLTGNGTEVFTYSKHIQMQRNCSTVKTCRKVNCVQT